MNKIRLDVTSFKELRKILKDMDVKMVHIILIPLQA